MRTEIDKNTELAPGDIIEIEFITRGFTYLRAVQMAIIESKLDKDPSYDVLSWRLEDDDRRVVFRIKIVQPVASVEIQRAGIGTAIAWAIVVVGGGLFVWLSLDKIYKITETPTGKLAISTAAAIVGLIIYKVLK